MADVNKCADKPCDDDSDHTPVKCIDCPELPNCDSPQSETARNWRLYRQGWRK